MFKSSVRHGQSVSAGTRIPRVLMLPLFLLAAILQPSTAEAQQSGVVVGRVIDRDTGSPLSGVSISIAGQEGGTLSTTDGGFRLAGVAAGMREVVARRVGLAPATRTVTVGAGATTRVEFALESEALLIPGVVVSTTREVRRLAETAASVGVVGRDELDDTRPTHPSEVMRRIPGVWVGMTAGEGHTMAIRMPKTTEPVYLYLEDGVPTRSTGFFNHNALYEVNLPQAGRIEVLKGPATALYGSDAIGGVIDVETRAPSLHPSTQAYVEGGQNGWTRALLSGSGTWGDDGVRTDLNLTRSDGWRDGTGYERQSATVRWDRQLGGGATLKSVLTASRIDQETAGSSALLRDDYLSDRTVNYTPISLRNVRAVRLSAALDAPVAGAHVSLTPYLRWNEMELLPNWSLTYDPTIYETGHSSVGVIARVSRDVAALRARVIAGIDADYSPGGREESRIDPLREGRIFTSYTRGERIYDYDVTYRAISPYLQLEADPLERLHVTAGLRYDRMAYDYRTHLDPVDSGRWRRPADATVEFDHLSPKLGLAYEFGEALSTYANYVHGFRAPSEGQLFRQGSAVNTVALSPVIANSFEVGARGELLGRIGYTLAAYRMELENDILTYIRPDGIRETQNAGETLHEGVEVGLSLQLSAALRADASYSLAEHTYLAWSPEEGVDYGGNEQEAAPQLLANARLSYSPSFLAAGRVGVEWSRVGSYWMDAENTHRYPGHNLFSLSANVPVGSHLELIGRVVNLTDERFAESAVYTLARGEEFAPGMPRTIYLGVEYGWGGDAR